MINKLHDQHLHSCYSLDSKEDITNYVSLSEKQNCSYFLTTEHIEFDSAYNHKDWTVDFPSLIKNLDEITNINKKIKPLLGVEIGYRKDKLDKIKDLINSYKFDVINMSIHDNGIYDYYIQKDYIDIGIDKMLDIYFKNALDGVKTFQNYDVLSHIDYAFKTAYLIDNSLDIRNYESYLVDIFNEVVKNNKTLEINFKVQRTINDENHLINLLHIYKKCGGKKITFSSDAHYLSQLEDYYNEQNKYFEIIKNAGFGELSYFVKRKEYKFKI